jgi:D-mannose binding lectin.
VARLLLAAGLLFASAGASAAVLGPGHALAPGQRLYSLDNKYFATLDRNGDFGVYRSGDGARAWSAGTRGLGAVSANMLRDGRLVLVNQQGQTVWSTPTRGRHRVFAVSGWGSAVIIDARKWKPRDKKAEPFAEPMLRRRARLDWQTPAAESPAMQQRRQQSQTPAKAKHNKRSPRTSDVTRR